MTTKKGGLGDRATTKNPEYLEALLKPNTRMVYFETPAMRRIFRRQQGLTRSAPILLKRMGCCKSLSLPCQSCQSFVPLA